MHTVCRGYPDELLDQFVGSLLPRFEQHIQSVICPYCKVSKWVKVCKCTQWSAESLIWGWTMWQLIFWKQLALLCFSCQHIMCYDIHISSSASNYCCFTDLCNWMHTLTSCFDICLFCFMLIINDISALLNGLLFIAHFASFVEHMRVLLLPCGQPSVVGS